MARNGKGAALKYTYEVEVEAMPAQRLGLHISVDASSSMRGRRIREACRGVEALASVLRPTDLYGCCTFDDEFQSLHRMMLRARVNLEKDTENIVANCSEGHGSAIWDAVAEGLDAIQEYARYASRVKAEDEPMPAWEQVVITDGGDYDSDLGLKECRARITDPGLSDYRFVVIGVGLKDRHAAKLERLCRKSDHTVFHREPDTAALERRLRKMGEEYLIRFSQTMTFANGARETKMREVRTRDSWKARGMLESAVGAIKDGGGSRGYAITGPSPASTSEQMARDLAKFIGPGEAMDPTGMERFYCAYPRHRGVAKPKALCEDQPHLLRWINGQLFAPRRTLCKKGPSCSRSDCWFAHTAGWRPDSSGQGKLCARGRTG